MEPACSGESGLSATEAALFAHDLKNLLATLLGHAELQYQRLEDIGGTGTELAASLRAMRLSAGRAAEMCADLQALARGGPPARRPVDLGGIAATALRLLEARADRAFRSRLDGPAGLEVVGDRLALERVVLNLLWNAWEAADAAGISLPEIRVSWGCGPQGAWLEVRDNGPGLPGGRLAGLSEAYRSTKGGCAPAAGCGLGLHAAAEVMRRHGGRLAGRNAPGGGAVLRLQFGLERELDFGAAR